jgi:hypothetical protein
MCLKSGVDGLEFRDANVARVGLRRTNLHADGIIGYVNGFTAISFSSGPMKPGPMKPGRSQDGHANFVLLFRQQREQANARRRHTDQRSLDPHDHPCHPGHTYYGPRPRTVMA